MGNKGYSTRGLDGSVTHYDEHGHKTSYSFPDLLGSGYTNYDAKGHKTGRSDPDLLGGYKHYDASGHKTGRSDPDGLGGYNHYDTHGNRTGSSMQTGYGHYSNNDGCYIATCVYGSYDCPQVWTLRKFRDDTLGSSVLGRLFIRTYYLISPRLVSLHGDSESLHSFWKKHLDKLVARLNDDGVQDTPYADKNWRKR